MEQEPNEQLLIDLALDAIQDRGDTALDVFAGAALQVMEEVPNADERRLIVTIAVDLAAKHEKGPLAALAALAIVRLAQNARTGGRAHRRTVRPGAMDLGRLAVMSEMKLPTKCPECGALLQAFTVSNANVNGYPTPPGVWRAQPCGHVIQPHARRESQ